MREEILLQESGEEEERERSTRYERGVFMYAISLATSYSTPNQFSSSGGEGGEGERRESTSTGQPS